MNCPICSSEMEHWEDKLEHILLEESYVCPDKHYVYEYHHGVHIVNFFKKEFVWSYWDTPDEVEKVQSEIRKYLESVK